MKNQNMVMGCVVSAVVAGVLGFYGGTKYETNQRGQFIQMGNRGGNAQGMNSNKTGMRNPSSTVQPGVGMRGGMILGEVTAKDDKTITVKMADGSSKNVILSDSTMYRIASDSKLDDVQVGKTISVAGTTNADGSTTATSIELNPAMRGLQGASSK